MFFSLKKTMAFANIVRLAVDNARAAAGNLSGNQTRSAPKAIDDWEQRRVEILEHMLAFDRGYEYYLDRMKRLIATIEEVLKTDHVVTEKQRADILDNHRGVLDSRDFSRSNLKIRQSFCDGKKVWWQQDFPDFDLGKVDLIGKVAELVTDKKIISKAFEQQNWMAPYQQMLITTCISAYFQQEEAMRPVHRNMRYALEKDGPKGAADLLHNYMKIPQAYISGAGPFLIKTLQQVSNSLKPGEKLETITKSVFSSILPMTKGELKVVRQNLDVDPEYMDFTDESIGSASIGETHICYQEKKPIAVLKFIKPVSAWMFLCEVDFLLTTVWRDLDDDSYEVGSVEAMNVKKCRQLLLFLIREFAREFDVEREAQGTKDAREIYYRPKIGIITPELLEYKTARIPALVLQYIKGQSLDTFMTQIGDDIQNRTKTKEEILVCLVPIQRRIAMLMALWLKELFWGSGRFDADPHKGNVIVPSCTELRAGATPWLCLIDFGSHGQLGRRAQCTVFKTLIAGEMITQMHDCMPKTFTVNPPPPFLGEEDYKKFYAQKTARYLKLQPVLEFFKPFKTMSEEDQFKLFTEVNARLEKKPNLHADNIKHVRDVIKSIWKICNIREDPEETERLVKKSMDYSANFDFGTIFLTVAQEAKTVGTCSSSSVLMYGRGLAYLDQMWRLSRTLCEDVEDDKFPLDRNKQDFVRYLGVGVPKCDRAKLINLIWSFFISKPRLTFDYATGCFFARDKLIEDKTGSKKGEKPSSRIQA